MIVDVKVPVLAESVAEATLLEWRKEAGTPVTSGDILIEIETDKVVLEVPAPESGVLTEIVKDSGASVMSNEVIARLDTEGAASLDAAGTTAAVVHEEIPAQQEASAAAESTAMADETLSPAVRKLVAEHQLDPTSIPGTGKAGRITKGDVIEYLELHQPPPESTRPLASAKTPPVAPVKTPPPPVAPARTPATPAATDNRGERRVPMTRIRARIAERLVEAQHTAAILTTFNEISMQPVMDLRSRHKERFEKVHGLRLGFMSFFTKAALQALRKFPVVNASIEGTDIVYHDYYDIGIAVGSPRGLVVPVLRDVDRLSFAGIESKIAEFGEKAKNGQLSVEELSGGTFTITNGGVFGSLLSTPILNPPQSGILGMHKTEQRPIVENGQVVIRPMMYVALSYDHRLIDGREAVQFLVTIKEALEDPERMLLEV